MPSARLWATAFSSTLAIVIAGANRYEADDLSDVKIQRAISNKALRGVMTQSLTFKVYTETGVAEGDSCTISSTAATSRSNVPTFYAYSVDHDGDVYTVTAYDRCKNLDIPFDYSNYSQFDNSGQKTSAHVMWYQTSAVLGDLAYQCGFANSQPSMSRRTLLCYKDFAGKTCRQILDDLSVAECGFFYCTESNTLGFFTFTPDLSGNCLTITDENCGEIKVLGTKSITDTYSEDETYNVITKQSSSTWDHTEIISGRYMDQTTAAAVAGQVLNHGGRYVYTGWNGSVIVAMVAPFNASIYYGSAYLPCYEQVYELGLMTVAHFSAAKPDTSFSQYQSLYQREIEARVTQGKSMGALFIGESGSGFRIKM